MKPNSKFMQRLQQMMIGRYGQNDTLNKVLNNTALLLIIITFFVRFNWLALITLLLIIISYWRTFSKKIYTQVAINRGFQKIWYPLVRPFLRLNYQIKQHWQFKFFHCAQCSQRIRIPRHHGNIRVTCPKCGYKFDAKS